MARRTIDETRELLLDTAATMLTESGGTVTIGKVDLLEVCRRAGLTTAGSAYKIWETQDDFRTELLRFVLDGYAASEQATDSVADAIRASASSLPPLPELIRSSVDVPEDVRKQERQSYVMLAAMLLASEDDPELAGQLHDADSETLSGYRTIYEAAAEAYGLAYVDPVDSTLFMTLVSAVTEGLAIRSVGQPDIVDRLLPGPDGDETDPHWSLQARAIVAFIDAFTQPVGAPATPDPAQGED